MNTDFRRIISAALLTAVLSSAVISSGCSDAGGDAAPAMLIPLIITAVISIILGIFPNAGLHLFDLAVMAGNQVFMPYM